MPKDTPIMKTIMGTIESYVMNILEMHKYLGISLGDQAINILAEFSDKRYLSTYDVHKIFRTGGKPMDYKNVHKRIKRLESLGCIGRVKSEDVKEEKPERGAKYYRISETGMFHLLINKYPTKNLHDILQTNGDYSIFEAFLYPYFNKETFTSLYRIKSPSTYSSFNFKTPYFDIVERIIDEIHAYLRNCCIEIYQSIMDINEISEDPTYYEDEDLKDTAYYLTEQKDNLAVSLLRLYSQWHKSKDASNGLNILAEDDKFMNLVDDLHKNFEKSYDIAMRMGKRS
jgi:hypothetical protein